jgi:G3E family GTPase
VSRLPAGTKSDRIPVVLIGGFLGSGKSTLLNRLLRTPDAGRAAVIVNEFGAIGIDQALVKSSRDDLVLLESGCVCCTIRGDLAESMRELYRQRASEHVPRFDWLAIETTGLAALGPILHTFALDPVLAARYTLSEVVVTVDAVNGGRTLDRYREAVDQVVHADRLMLTKVDLAQPQDVARLTARLVRLNPGAKVGAGGADEALCCLPPRTQRDPGRVLSELAARLGAAREQMRGALTAARESEASPHDAGIGTFCLVHEEPFRWDDVGRWLDGLASAAGDRLLRVKGLLNVAGAAGPLLVQGAQHLIHPPVWLRAWPDANRRSRIVFITRDLDRGAVEAALDRALLAVSEES